MTPVRIGFVQFTPAIGDRVAARVETNLSALDGFLECNRPDADLIVLPELFATGYYFRAAAEPARLAERAGDGPTAEALRRWARRYGGTWVGGFVERGPGRSGRTRLWNAAMVVPPEGEIGLYRKVHLFYEESRWFAPGDLGLPVFPWATRAGPARLGVMICYDWRFPEAARSLLLGGAEVIAHPSNLVMPHGQEAMKTRALENGVFAVTANRGGEESNGKSKLLFTGRSQIVGPDGSVLAAAPDAADRATVVAVDLGRARAKEITPRNNLLADRRPEVYGRLVERAAGRPDHAAAKGAGQGRSPARGGDR